ncbi:hypothetical protein GCM10009706_04660 [Curtobacterium citreum]|uniref:DUF475 domain-containing protein n=1 Tax=Curtobacterium citreum TaxID=2036 RepID=A0ABT2HDH5_9MICO|nr:MULTISPECIES: DUF475 domain-containing protein [Curtobacterium]MCS5488199.1 DUF475 domain-containing protein [Curtobacterium flaccumfaciens pv. basellae]KTR24089.1 membrane protein [Curtobacterium citreum]MCS6521257.1 DUF475 domain-containing protein [Curtobacterium citreum]TQJ28113.1 hypothetical protein FB462_1991 [Curtobacterium citreum]GGL69423.1 hypothetical protein GCM10009706_04660 [Curtobacterium citreum]
MFLKTFGWSLVITVLALATALIYGSWTAVVITLILGVLEISLSFDNAVVNARILERMSPFWQKMFLTVGIVIAVFGMRVLFPLLIVGITAQLNPVEAVQLALEKGPIDEPGTYAYLLHEAHPQIAAFGGMFLLMIFLDFMFEDRDILWLKWLERPLHVIGKLPMVNVVVALVLLAVFAVSSGDHQSVVLIAGIAGLVTYFLVTGLGGLFDVDDPEDEGDALESTDHMVAEADRITKKRRLGHVAGRAAFLLFLYLEVIDASFSFDGVIGAFAITADPIIIALGLGLIGAMFVRSLTVFLVRQGTLDEFEYLDHGAHWAIGALAVILLVTITTEVNEVVTGLIGVVFILAAFISSVVRNRRKAAAEQPAEPAQLVH